MAGLDQLQVLTRAKFDLASGQPARKVLEQLLQQLPDSTELEQAARVVEQIGISLTQLVELLIDNLEFEARIKAHTRQALAAIRQTRVILIGLPVAMLALTQLAGFGTVRLLVTTGLGWLVVAISGALIWAANASISRHVLKTQVPLNDPGFKFVLAAACLTAGTNLPIACEVVGINPDFIAGDSVTSQLLQRQATHLRSQAEQRKQQWQVQLPEKLVTSTAGFLLPACLLLTVVPFALGAFQTTQFQ